MCDPKGLNFLGFVDESTPEDVCTALAIINGGVVDFQNYTDAERKKNCVSLDSSDAVAASMRALLRVLRDGSSTQLLADSLRDALLSMEAEPNSIYGTSISDR